MRTKEPSGHQQIEDGTCAGKPWGRPPNLMTARESVSFGDQAVFAGGPGAAHGAELHRAEFPPPGQTVLSSQLPRSRLSERLGYPPARRYSSTGIELISSCVLAKCSTAEPHSPG